MYQTQTMKEKIALFTKVLIPILITQVGIYLMNVFDTVMAGQASAEDLAGVAIGSSIWIPVLTGINGILLAISPIVAQLTGANKRERIPFAVKQGLYLAIAISFTMFMLGFFFLDSILSLLSIDPNVYHVAKYYLTALGVGMVFLFSFNLMRSFIDALGQTKTSMLIILFALPLNAFFNYMFIFGNFGAPELGGVGAGVASAITYMISFFLSVIIVHNVQPFRRYQVFKQFVRPSLSAWKEQLKIGVPIGFTIFFETSIFAAVTLFISVYDTITIAAHQAAMNFASIFYMLPLAIAMALTISVGFEVGGKRIHDAKVYSLIGISSGLFFAILSGVLIFVFREEVSQLYSNDPDVIQLMQHFLIYAIFFQLSDGFGTPIQGALRGYKDVNVTLVIAFISFWIIGLPSGILIAQFTSLGPFGYWVGLIIGLATGAIILIVRLIQRLKLEASP
ncbi:MATE family efflux transporter [Alkalibacillus haloalkaliphilus]|uniref:Probable multidrug resistance protein NorM n=1 Tax=Alkalibacillus haloalkaliphilus TaxID=94136 RepID=A0A511W4B2_9BACI|nr:MATE family efflux transporter [Alkalibacillus haloalkaliphilus]GEN45797.1 putative multidrug resistance protein NorM [Alkalibacillus haloalkaliphilus]